MNTQEIATVIYKALRDAGYTCEENCGTIYIDGPDGKTYWMQPQECEKGEADDDKVVCCECDAELDPESDNYRETEDGRPICAECKHRLDEELAR